MEEYQGITKDEAFELFPHVTTLTFGPSTEVDDEAYIYQVKVAYRGKQKFAIIWMNECWNGSEWVYESSPSNRTEEFIAQTRFDLKEAIEIAKELPAKVVVNGMTWEQMQAWKAIRRAEAAQNAE